MTSSATHWDQVYQTKRAEQVSWFRPHLDVSIELSLRAGLNKSSRIIDIGAGASTLVDDLLARGSETVTALDISAAALQVTRDRLGDRATRVHRIVSDVTQVELPRDSIEVEARRETHATPRGAPQAFAYALLRKGDE